MSWFHLDFYIRDVHLARAIDKGIIYELREVEGNSIVIAGAAAHGDDFAIPRLVAFLLGGFPSELFFCTHRWAIG